MIIHIKQILDKTKWTSCNTNFIISICLINSILFKKYRLILLLKNCKWNCINLAWIHFNVIRWHISFTHSFQEKTGVCLNSNKKFDNLPDQNNVSWNLCSCNCSGLCDMFLASVFFPIIHKGKYSVLLHNNFLHLRHCNQVKWYFSLKLNSFSRQDLNLLWYHRRSQGIYLTRKPF